MTFEDDGSDRESAGLPSTADLERLSSALTTKKRDELLQCLLATAPRGGEAIIEVLEQLLLCHAAEELWEGDHGSGSGGSGDARQHHGEGD